MIETDTRTNRLIWLAAIVLATVAVYARTMNYGLVNWDEPLAGIHLYQETPSLEGLGVLLKPRLAGTYQPVRALATAMLAPYGAKANWVPYHAVSLLFYLGTLVFLYLIAQVLIGKLVPGAGGTQVSAAALGAAALFALHPSHTEAVAWVSGQKDAFVAFFYLASLYFYIRGERPGIRDYLICLLMFVLAMGSKPSAVSLPLVLVAYDLTVRSSSGNRQALRKLWPGYLPFFIPALAAVVFFMLSTARVGAVIPDLGGSAARLVKAAAALGFSAIKLILPVNLCLRYPGFVLDPGRVDIYLYSLAGVAILAWTIHAVKRDKPQAFLLGWFVLALAPNSNLVKIVIERADRYYYLSSAAFAILIACGALELYRRSARPRRRQIKWLSLAALLLLGACCWRQAGYWGSAVSAWSRVYELYPGMMLARLGIAMSYLRSGDLDQALRLYRPLLEGKTPNTEAIKGAVYISMRRNDKDKAIELARLGHALDPKDEDFLSTLTRQYFAKDDTAAAALVISEWIEKYPDSPEGLLNYGNLLWRRGENDKAELIFRRLTDKYSYFPEPFNALAKIKLDAGQFSAAEKLYRESLATGRRTTATRQQLASLYEKMGRTEKALQIYSRYDMQDLGLPGLEFMGARFFSQGDYPRSLEYFQQMARRDPTLSRAYSNSAVVLEKMGRAAESDSLYARAISLDSSYVDAWFNRGNLAYSQGKLKLAESYFRRADSLAGGEDRAVREALAGVLAATGDTAGARRLLEHPGETAKERNGGRGEK